MRYETITIYGAEITGFDDLNNPVTEPVVLGTYRGMLTPWTVEEIAIKGRNVTQTEQKLVTNTPRSVIERAKHVEIAGRYYSVVLPVRDVKRWRICTIKELP